MNTVSPLCCLYSADQRDIPELCFFLGAYSARIAVWLLKNPGCSRMADLIVGTHSTGGLVSASSFRSRTGDVVHFSVLD
jgi:hypothetical protein